MPGVTRCRHAGLDVEAELPTDALKAWQARGWEPVSGESRTREEAEAQDVEAENAAALRATGGPISEPGASDSVSILASSDYVITPQDPGSGDPAGDAGTTEEGEVNHV